MTYLKRPLSGIHHVTAIASDPRTNVLFYTEVLGQRLVKKTVNFDDPQTYHLYYGDVHGSPGSIMTFFPWPKARRGRPGAGQANATSYAVPPHSLSFWNDRLREHGVTSVEQVERFGEAVLRFRDPDGLPLELVEVEGMEERSAWLGTNRSPVLEQHAIQGFRGVTLASSDSETTARFLVDVMGFSGASEDGETTRFWIAEESGGALGTTLDVQSGAEPGRGGAGTVHHVAFRVADDANELAWQSQIEREGHHVSPVMDRQYFRSIYFREPGGVLFEIATDGPGFAVDEPGEALGQRLMLPPSLETMREQIEDALPELGVDSH